ncbi:MAG: SMC-Scp complex subunit ScpB [Acidimicrobiia bacterium]|jgi:segregation and condensation protein B
MGAMIDSSGALEAILFVTEAPVPESELAEVLEVPVDEVAALLEGLAGRLAERGSALEIRRTAGGWRLYTRPDAYPYLERFSASATARRLSAAALETLAVVAYRQPVSRGQLAELRGVDSDSALRTLERLGLVEEAARLPTPGNPAVYRTTPLFLEKLGIDTLEALPPLADHVPPADVVETLEETFRAEP